MAVIVKKRRPVPILTQVRAEAARRMRGFTGARDDEHLTVIISNANREAIRLLRKGAENWTAEEQARAAYLEAADDHIEAIRNASNVLEAMHPDPGIPDDFRDDKHWPTDPA